MLTKLCFGFVILGITTQTMAAYGLSPRQEIYYWASQANLQKVRQLQQAGYSIDLLDNTGNTALCEAVWRQDRIAVNILLSAGANTNVDCMQQIPMPHQINMGINPNNSGYTTNGRNIIPSMARSYDMGPYSGGVSSQKRGLSSATWAGIVGGAALLGGGIALGMSGGGGGNSGDSENNDIPQKDICNHGAMKADGTCVCNNLWQTVGTNYCNVCPLTAGPNVDSNSCKCVGNTVRSLNTCVETTTITCSDAEYWDGFNCQPCPSEATSDHETVGISSCKCPEGKGIRGNECVPVDDFGNLNKHPANQNPTTFKTAEFSKGNFLNQINAQYAYARGYNGYLANKDATGDLISNNLTDTKIKVGVWDSSFDVSQPDLAPNIARRQFLNGTTKTYGYNTQLGPCREKDKDNPKNCYGIEESYHDAYHSYGYIVWYDNEGHATRLTDTKDYTMSDIVLKYLKNGSYPTGYDWDEESVKYNVSPKNTKVDEISNVADDHGTHVAGIVAATKNETGMQGVVPNAELYLAQWTNDNVANIDKYYAAQFFADSGVCVVNASFGVNTNKTATEFSLSPQLDNIDVLGYKKAYQTYADNDIVLVKSAGNDGNGGKQETTYMSAIPMVPEFSKNGAHDLTNLFINVAAVDKQNTLASYSQYCGSTGAWCLVAPGGDIDKGTYIWETLNDSLKKRGTMDEADIRLDTDVYGDDIEWTRQLVAQYDNKEINLAQVKKSLYSYWGITSTVQNDSNHSYLTDDNTSYGIQQGTSMAAPVVTGAVALLMSAYPHLTSQQVVEILFRSANTNLTGWGSSFKSGYYDESGYWHTTTVTDEIDEDGWQDSFGNAYDLSKIYGHGMVDLKAATEPLGELKVAIGKSVSTKQSLKNTKLALPRFVNNRLGASAAQTVLGLDDYNRPFTTSIEGKIHQAYHNPDAFMRDFKSFMNKNKVQLAGVQDKLSFAFSSTNTDKNLMGLGIFDMNYQFNDSTALNFSYRSDILNEKEAIDKALSNPFMNMTNSYSLAQKFKWKDFGFSFGGTIGKNAFYETDEEKEDEFKRSVHAFNTEVSYSPSKSLTFKMVGGMMQEKEALLGMNGTGLFETDDGKTYFTGALMEYHPFVPFTLSASYYYGRSALAKSKGLVNIDHVISDSFAFDARYQSDEKDTFGFQFASPLRIRQGSAIFNMPVARDLYTDEVYFDEQKISLKPQSREYDFSLYYMTQTDLLDWRGELMMRLHPDHMSGVQPDYRALFGLSYKY